jgi:hypothetical protein
MRHLVSSCEGQLVKAVRPNSVRKWSLFFGLAVAYFREVLPTWKFADMYEELNMNLPMFLHKGKLS